MILYLLAQRRIEQNKTDTKPEATAVTNRIQKVTQYMILNSFRIT